MRRPALACLLIAGPLLLMQGQAWSQQQWKWRDANGHVTVSDLPPPRAVPEKDILQRPVVNPTRAAARPVAASAPAASAAKPGSDKELEARKRAVEAERKAAAKAEEDKQAAQRAENCQRARAQLVTMESGQRVARINDKGEREFLDDAQRAAEARRAREGVASECR